MACVAWSCGRSIGYKTRRPKACCPHAASAFFRYVAVASPLEAATPSRVRSRCHCHPSSVPAMPHATRSLPAGPHRPCEAAFHRRSWTLPRRLPVSLRRCLPWGAGEAVVPFPSLRRRFALCMSESCHRLRASVAAITRSPPKCAARALAMQMPPKPVGCHVGTGHVAVGCGADLAWQGHGPCTAVRAGRSSPVQLGSTRIQPISFNRL
jgi:hypothetical protein